MKKILPVILMLLSLLFTGCSRQDTGATENDALISVPSYTYYGVAFEETEIEIDVALFCPTDISLADLKNTKFTFGNTNCIQIIDSDVFETYEISAEEYYYADIYFTLDVTIMTSNILQFSTLTYTVPGQASKVLQIGPIIIDNHYRTLENASEIAAGDEDFATTTPNEVIVGYPDNPTEYSNITEFYPNVACYRVRPVYAYVVGDQVYYEFQTVQSDYIKDMGLKDLLKTSQSVNAQYQ